jgi:hypothetical protein
MLRAFLCAALSLASSAASSELTPAFRFRPAGYLLVEVLLSADPHAQIKKYWGDKGSYAILILPRQRFGFL